MPDQITIKYKKPIPIFILCCAILILGTSAIIGFSLNTITGIIVLILAIQMFNNPMVILVKGEVQMKNLLGMVIKRHEYTPEDVSIEGKSIRIKGKKVVSSWWADFDPEQVREFMMSK